MDWLFPVGDEGGELGDVPMFNEMLNAIDNRTVPMEIVYDGYVVNAIMDACYRSNASKKWEPIGLAVWRGAERESTATSMAAYDDVRLLVKEELMPDGRTKRIFNEKTSGQTVEPLE